MQQCDICFIECDEEDLTTCEICGREYCENCEAVEHFEMCEECEQDLDD